jgi:hypothetical protein
MTTKKGSNINIVARTMFFPPLSFPLPFYVSSKIAASLNHSHNHNHNHNPTASPPTATAIAARKASGPTADFEPAFAVW